MPLMKGRKLAEENNVHFSSNAKDQRITVLKNVHWRKSFLKKSVISVVFQSDTAVCMEGLIVGKLV